MRPVPCAQLSRARRRSRLVHAVLFVLASLLIPVSVAAAAERVEEPFASASPQADVTQSLVKIKVPLPARTAAHPEACDWLQYVRWRSADGPAKSADADSVVVLMPGILEGAMAFDVLARNSIREAARRGRHIEVWGLDRRANCLEDLTGVKAYGRTGNLDDLLGYYWRGKTVDGRTFDGFDRNNRVLKDIGMAQTVNDVYAVMTNETPSQAWREQHLVCGGHSLGGPIFQIFGGWDFDGDRRTNDDAGYRQCAGFVGFESTLDLDPTTDAKWLQGLIATVFLGRRDAARTAGYAAIKAGLIPARADIGGADPRSALFMEAVAADASRNPGGDATALLRGMPYSKTMYDYFHTVGSASLNKMLFTKDSIRQYRYTNMGLLGQLLDDNGAPFSAVRASFGFFDGAPVRRNLLPGQLCQVPVLCWAFQPNQMFLPAYPTRTTPLMGWKNYDQVGGKGQPGEGSTSPQSEVTDANDLARLLHEGPTNFMEPYMPTRIVTDLTSWYGGDRFGDLSHFFYNHPLRNKPRMESLGGSGVANKAKLGSPDPFVMNPGYEHVDSITAAERQNNGKPEGSTKVVVDMVDAVVPR
ncbi:MAG: hypothetical protein PGN13_10030 [Patulibacter minatonensis]